MSWSPSPSDYEAGILREGESVNRPVKLPSQTARQHGGGTSLVDRNRKQRRKSARERIAGVPPAHLPPLNQDYAPDKEAPTPSGKAEVEETSLTVVVSGEECFDDFTYKDLDALKELNCSMAKKKEIRSKLIAEQGKKIAGNSRWSYDMSVRWRRFKDNATDTLHRAKLWQSSLHEIEGRFGTGIRSYFAFLRWLFTLNIYIFLLIFFFIVIPTIVFQNLNGSQAISIVSAERNISAECQYDPYNPNTINTFPQYIIWWFTGQGFMENTLLFCGYYDNAATTIQTSSFSFHYNIPLAYLLVAFFYLLLSLVLVVRKAAYGLKESLSSDDQFFSYCNLVFNGWDYCINDGRAADLKHQSIKLEVEVDLEEDRIRARHANRTRNEKIKLYSKRVVINIVVVSILVASLAAIFFAAQYALQNGTTYDDNFFLDLLITYLTSIVITAANFVAPVLFGILVNFEDYSPDFTIRFTLARTVVLRLASIVFLYVVVYLQINCNRYSNIVSNPFNSECGHCVGVECWETYLGQEMYKLTLLDFLIVIGVTLFVEFPRKLLVEYSGWQFIRKYVGLQEFSITKNVLGLTYSQTLTWIGAFYAPLLPVMVVIKFFVFFYLKKLTLTYNCRPASRPYRASRSGTFFYVILLFGFAVAVFPVAISVSIITPSIDCGPFRSWPSMFYVITDSILTLSNWAQEMFWFFGSSGFAAVIVLLLCLGLYYLYATNSAQKITIRLLQNQLTMEGKDKQYLLKRVNELGQEYEKAQQNKSRKRGNDGAEALYDRQNVVDDNLPGQTNNYLF